MAVALVLMGCKYIPRSVFRNIIPVEALNPKPHTLIYRDSIRPIIPFAEKSSKRSWLVGFIGAQVKA